MGFIRKQEEQMAVRFIRWQYQKADLPAPDPAILKRKAANLVDDAHRIAQERGRNVISILKEMLKDIKDKESS